MSLSTAITKLDFISKLDEQVKTLEAESATLYQTFERQKTQDFLIFKSLLAFEKNRYQPKPLQPVLSYQEELLLELGTDSNTDEEEGSNFDNASFLREISTISSKKTSIFSLNADSRRNSLFAPNGGRLSAFSEFPKRRDSYFSKLPNAFQQKRSSAFLLPPISQKNEDLKKRNSAILEDVSNKLMNTVNLPTQKNILDKIKRASLKCNLSISSLRLSEQNYNHNLDSLNQIPVGEEAVFSESGSDSQSDDSEEEHFEDFKEENYYKISFLKYDDKVFKESRPLQEEINTNLKNMNLLEDFCDELTNGASNNPKTGPRRAKKFKFMDPKAINYRPYYLLNHQGVVKHKQRNRKGATHIARKISQTENKAVDQQQLSKQDEEPSESIIEFGSAKNLRAFQNPQSDDYRFFLSTGVSGSNQNDELLSNNPEIYTMTFKDQTLYSQSLHLGTLKDCLIYSHFQMKFKPPNTIIPPDSSSIQAYNLNEQITCFQNNFAPKADSCISKECHIRDNGSKRGTFVQTGPDHPIILQEGNLFLFNRKCGFYVKKIEEDMKPEEEAIAEVVRFSEKTIAQPTEFISIPNSLPSPIDEENNSTASPKTKLNAFLENDKCAGIKLELVKWNEAFEHYEEHGAVIFLFDTMAELSNLDGGEPSYSQTIQQSCIDISKTSKVFDQIMTKLNVDHQILLFYDVYLDSWTLEQKPKLPQAQIGQVKQCYQVTFGESLTRQQRAGGFTTFANPKKDECTNLGALWMSVSNFNILQEEFGNEWVKIELPSVIMFENIIFKMSEEKLPTSYE